MSIYKSLKSVYEAHGERADGSSFTEEVMECGSDEEAMMLAGVYARRWRTAVAVYQVPAINLSSCSSFNLWPSEMRLVVRLR